jgi:hypothetical protein
MVSLELRGPSGELSDGSVRPAVIVDLSGVQPGEKSFPVGSSNVVLPRGVRLERAIPADVRFHFERRAPRSVKVEPRFTGEGEGGYVLAHWSVEPEELIILGPASRVAGIGKVSTDPVDLTGVVGAAEFHVNAFVEDSFVRFKSFASRDGGGDNEKKIGQYFCNRRGHWVRNYSGRMGLEGSRRVSPRRVHGFRFWSRAG